MRHSNKHAHSLMQTSRKLHKFRKGGGYRRSHQQVLETSPPKQKHPLGVALDSAYARCFYAKSGMQDELSTVQTRGMNDQTQQQSGASSPPSLSFVPR